VCRVNATLTTLVRENIVTAIDSLSSRVMRPETADARRKFALSDEKAAIISTTRQVDVSFEITWAAARTLLSSPPSIPCPLSLSLAERKIYFARRRRMHLPTDWCILRATPRCQFIWQLRQDRNLYSTERAVVKPLVWALRSDRRLFASSMRR